MSTSREARMFLKRTFSSWGLGLCDPAVGAAGAAELILSELVINSVRYAGERDIEVSLTAHHDRLVVSVEDGNSTIPQEPGVVLSDENGRGLLIVAALARKWGTAPAQGGKRVWARLDLPAGSVFAAGCGFMRRLQG